MTGSDPIVCRIRPLVYVRFKRSGISVLVEYYIVVAICCARVAGPKIPPETKKPVTDLPACGRSHRWGQTKTLSFDSAAQPLGARTGDGRPGCAPRTATGSNPARRAQPPQPTLQSARRAQPPQPPAPIRPPRTATSATGSNPPAAHSHLSHRLQIRPRRTATGTTPACRAPPPVPIRAAQSPQHQPPGRSRLLQYAIMILQYAIHCQELNLPCYEPVARKHTTEAIASAAWRDKPGRRHTIGVPPPHPTAALWITSPTPPSGCSSAGSA